MSYQGHLSDGSSVQRHSAGPIYPCVIFARQTDDGLTYGVITPSNQDGVLCGAYDSAVDLAKAWLRNH